MRIWSTSVFAFVFVASTAFAADDPPTGAIGVQLKINDGKIVVIEPLKDGPADKAGIKADDTILKVNEFVVKDPVEHETLHDTVKEIGKYKPGEKVKLTVKRGDKEMTIEVTVGKRAEVIKEKD